MAAPHNVNFQIRNLANILLKNLSNDQSGFTIGNIGKVYVNLISTALTTLALDVLIYTCTTRILHVRQVTTFTTKHDTQILLYGSLASMRHLFQNKSPTGIFAVDLPFHLICATIFQWSNESLLQGVHPQRQLACEGHYKHGACTFWYEFGDAPWSLYVMRNVEL